MVFSVVLRRAAANAARSARGFRFENLQRQQIMKGGIFREETRKISSSFGFSRFYSSGLKMLEDDLELVRILESEIQCAKEEFVDVEEAPKGFPFEIQDEGTNMITLRRDYHGENIEVVVSMPDVEDTGYNEEGGDDNEEEGGDDNKEGGDHNEEEGGDENHDEGDENSEKTDQLTIPLTINISKGEKSNLEFCCTAYADELVIHSLCVRGNKGSDDLLAYEGPDFDDLDENLQKAFNKYLEVRGMSSETISYIHKYLINKDDREYLMWLQHVKHFLEKQ